MGKRSPARHHLKRPATGPAAAALGEAGEALRDRLNDPDRRVRLAAVAELCGRDDEAGAELLDLALDDRSRLVRFRAVEALGKLGHPRALQLLLARMDDETQPTMLRRFALDAIAAIGSVEAADALEARMESFPSRRGQRVVARKIAAIRRTHGT